MSETEQLAAEPQTTVRRRVPVPEVGLWLSAAAISAWLCALFVGWALGGAIHLLLLIPLWVRPWRVR